MPAWLEIILNILLFIFCLSTLILVHEAGHFAMAKLFKVYCDDFSIGFGKAFFSKRRKGGETSFSLRIFPLGGFVAMAAEEGEIREGVNVPKERTIAGVAKWKAAIIMSAGIIVNIIVSILLLYISNQCFITEGVYPDAFTVKEDGIAEKAGFMPFNPETGEGNFVSVYSDSRPKANAILYYSLTSYANYDDGTKTPVAAVIDQNELTLKNYSFDNLFHFYPLMVYNVKGAENDNYKFDMVGANFQDEITPDSVIKENPTPKEGVRYSGEADPQLDVKAKLTSIDLVINTYAPAPKAEADTSFYCTGCGKNISKDELLKNEKGEIYLDANGNAFHETCENYNVIRTDKKTNIQQKLSLVIPRGKSTGIKEMQLKVIPNPDQEGKLMFEDVGLSMFKHSHWQGFGEAWVNTFKQFGQGSALIFTSIGKLFIGQGWENMGSIISIYNQQSMILNGFGASKVVYYWGLISVNLAIFNLLPFPGLDGWQLLVIAVEGITRKKIPDKVKTIMSYVGLGLLLVLMVVLIIKDIIVMI